MKTKSILTNIVLSSAIAIVSMSCNSAKTDDTKAIATEHNDAKFNNADSEKDAKFLVEAAEINLEEIKLGQLAQNKSSRSDVKDLGKMMETDHSKALEELKGLASKKNITIPSSIAKEGQDAYEKLNNKLEKDFDKSYCDMMVDGHKGAIEKFEKASTESSDADIRSWASGMLPGLRMHLDHALNCQQKCEKM